MNDQSADKKETQFPFYYICVFAAFPGIPSSDSASVAPLYPECDHKATNPKNVLTRSCSAEYPHAE